MFCVNSVTKICQDLLGEVEKCGGVAFLPSLSKKKFEIDVFHAALQLTNRWFFLRILWMLCGKLPKNLVFLISQFTCKKSWVSNLHLTKSRNNFIYLVNDGMQLKCQDLCVQVLKREIPQMIPWIGKQKWMSMEEWKSDPMFKKEMNVWRPDVDFDEKQRYVRRLISEMEYEFWFTLRMANELIPPIRCLQVIGPWIIIDKNDVLTCGSGDDCFILLNQRQKHLTIVRSGKT